MKPVEIAADERPESGKPWLMIRRYRRRDGYDYYVTASPSLEARLPRPLPIGGLGFATYEAAHLFSQGLATAQAVDTLYVTFTPPEHGHWPALALPSVHPCEAENLYEAELHEGDAAPAAGRQWLDALLERCAGRPAVATAVAHPCDAASLGAAMEAAERGLIRPLLVGPEHKIRAAAEAAGVDLHGVQLIPEPHSHAAAAQAVALVRAGQAQLLMKGSLHTEELMHAVLDRSRGLRTERRVSHVYIVEAPAYPRPLLITDAAINISPTLEEKRDIVQNAIDLAHVMGIHTPRVAVLSAVETVSAKLQSTIDAAALCKMADRGQITGALIDGPLAFDNAVSPQAAESKGIRSPVAGRADILVTPDLVSGNILAKQLTFMGGAEAAGVALGARVPIILTSRADAERTRVASCAVAALMASQGAQP
ncbi:bifunctional enoyl-CoA hydratase/phosphate acetyltransferase [Phenylobacterium sp.]|uniref:bifunctional enoyl-CoA hydratase/phosphate acetyltransferase n=1 Tax=Phenylobacterium sp. TaxID=1871053 RepID=UPI0025D4BC96|nr:bifunctional enoyl-CoA hydratase/phosphate acetyltransferase [Phenylobacterium sp.]